MIGCSCRRKFASIDRNFDQLAVQSVPPVSLIDREFHRIDERNRLKL
jgi:hypothetical protein